MPGFDFDTAGGMRELAADLDLMVAAARKAGKIGLQYFGKKFDHWTKGDRSPVTEADLAIDQFLQSYLLKERAEYGWLSEESEKTVPHGRDARMFVIDPIDGTRAFLAKDDQWCVSIALISDQQPIAGVLYRPVRDNLFEAVVGQGAKLDGTTLKLTDRTSLNEARVAAPKKIFAHNILNSAGAVHPGYVPSLALRIAKVATGDFDAAIALPNCHDWDVAAADLILQEAGGVFCTYEGLPIQYGLPGSKQPGVIACKTGLYSSLRELIV